MEPRGKESREPFVHMGLTILNSVEAAQAFGESWAADLVGGEIFALHGVLGAGKTQLVKGLARGLGYRGDVTSPTFTIVHEYRGGRLPIYHIDLYRIQSEKEAIDIGLEEYLPERRRDRHRMARAHRRRSCRRRRSTGNSKSPA